MNMMQSKYTEMINKKEDPEPKMEERRFSREHE